MTNRSAWLHCVWLVVSVAACSDDPCVNALDELCDMCACPASESAASTKICDSNVRYPLIYTA